MIKYKALYSYTTEELISLAFQTHKDFGETGNLFDVQITENKGELPYHKIHVLGHIMMALQTRHHDAERKIKDLNEKIKQQGIELSKLKRKS